MVLIAGLEGRLLTILGPRYTKPELQAEKNRAHHKHKENIEMMGCLQVEYSITRQSVITKFFLYLWWARFFSTCSPGLVFSIFWALAHGWALFVARLTCWNNTNIILIYSLKISFIFHALGFFVSEQWWTIWRISVESSKGRFKKGNKEINTLGRVYSIYSGWTVDIFTTWMMDWHVVYMTCVNWYSGTCTMCVHAGMLVLLENSFYFSSCIMIVHILLLLLCKMPFTSLLSPKRRAVSILSYKVQIAPFIWGQQYNRIIIYIHLSKSYQGR